MARSLFIRFVCSEGGVALFVNGFLLVGPEEAGRTGAHAAPYLRPGENLVELVPDRPDASATASVVALEGDDPEAAPVLLALSTAQAPTPGATESDMFFVDWPTPVFAWTRAEPIDDIDAHAPTLYRGLETFRQWLEIGPDADLLAMVSLKHEEIGVAMGVAPAEIDAGLIDGLQRLRVTPGFRVDLAPADDFLPLVSTDRGIVMARRRSGGDALRIIDGVLDPGFSMALARIDERWTVVR